MGKFVTLKVTHHPAGHPRLEEGDIVGLSGLLRASVHKAWPNQRAAVGRFLPAVTSAGLSASIAVGCVRMGE